MDFVGRKLLSKGDKLSIRNADSGELIELEIISEPLGEGSSSVVYEAKSTDRQLVCKYRLKELYPEHIEGISRGENNSLVIDDSCAKQYLEACVRFDKALELLWEFAYSDSTGAYTVCPLGKFIGTGDGTASQYLITQWMPSDNISTASLCGTDNLNLAAKICLKTASAIDEFHQKGYINFDIKPENILYSPKTDNIAFFDTDTVFRKNSSEKAYVSFSDGAAPEIINGFSKLYSEKSDVFSIGSMLHRFVTGENYLSGQYSLNYNKADDVISEYPALRYSNPYAAALVLKIWSCCCSGSPAKRCDISTLVQMLEQLTELTLPDSIYAENSYVQPPDDKSMEYIDEMYSIRQKLLTHNFVFVQGLHGSGKTNFVKNYVYNAKRFYHTVVWVDYKDSIRNTISKIKFVGINDEEFNDTDKLFEIKFNQLKKYDNEMLMIVDGYDTPDEFTAEFAESLNIHILITSSCNNNKFNDEHIYTMKQEQKQMFNQEEKSELQKKMTKLKNASCSLRTFYTVLIFVFLIMLIAAVSIYEFISTSFGVLIMISIALILILKALIFNCAEKEAVFGITRKYCNKYYKEASLFASIENNNQTFEIAAPEFVSLWEDKRHKFRLILGVAAIVCGVITAVISFIINSFPFLIAIYALILLVVFMIDYGYSVKITQNIYNAQFGDTAENEKRDLYEIYRFKTPDNINSREEKIGPDCARLIIYNEYKTRCELWGTVDVVAKVFAGINILIVILNFVSIIPNQYFHIPSFLPENTCLYLGIIIYVLLSAIPVIMCRDFYYNVKELLFTVFSDDNKYISQKFAEYTDEALLRNSSFARGIYSFAVSQFEKGIPIYEIRRAERPTFAHYCTTQNSRTCTYFAFLIIIQFSIVVWHFSFYAAIIPLLAVNAGFLLWWYLSGMYIINKSKLGIGIDETDK